MGKPIAWSLPSLSSTGSTCERVDYAARCVGHSLIDIRRFVQWGIPITNRFEGLCSDDVRTELELDASRWFWLRDKVTKLEDCNTLRESHLLTTNEVLSPELQNHPVLYLLVPGPTLFKTGSADPAITISKELHYGCARDLTLIVQPNYLYHAGYTLSVRVFSVIYIFLADFYFSINLWFV